MKEIKALDWTLESQKKTTKKKSDGGLNGEKFLMNYKINK